MAYMKISRRPVLSSGTTRPTPTKPLFWSQRYLLPAGNQVLFGYYPGGTDAEVQQYTKPVDIALGWTMPLNNYYLKVFTQAGIDSSINFLNATHVAGGRLPRIDFDWSQYAKAYGRPIATLWTDISTGKINADFVYNGVTIRGIDYIIKALMSMGQRMFVSHSHEMDLISETGGDGTTRCGTAAQFRAAWQYIVTRARSFVTADPTLLECVWCFDPAYDPTAASSSGAYKWGDVLTDAGSDGLYPGHNYVDWVGCDPYNWAGVSGHGNNWWNPQNTASGNPFFKFITWWNANFKVAGARTQALQVGSEGVYKPAMLGECGTNERWTGLTYTGDTGDASVWMTKLADWCDVGGAANGIVRGICWFGRDYLSGDYVDNGVAMADPDWSIRGANNPSGSVGTIQKWQGIANIRARAIFWKPNVNTSVVTDRVKVSVISGLPNYGPAGSYQPDVTTTGVPAGTTLVAYGGGSPSNPVDLVLTTPNQTFDSIIVYGRVRNSTYGCTITRSKILGLQTADTNTGTGGDMGVVDSAAGGASLGPNGNQPLTLSDCEISNVAFPHYAVNGVFGRHVSLVRCYIHDVVDCIDILWASNGSATIVFDVDRCLLDKMSLISPDPNHTGDSGTGGLGRTHNDGIQIHNTAGWRIVGSTIKALKSTTTSNATTSWDPSVTGSAINITQDAGAARNGTISNNYIYAGQQQITVTLQNGGAGNMGTCTNNVCDLTDSPSLLKNGTTRKRNILYDSGITWTLFSGNTQPGGAAAVVEVYAGAS
jgi:hypothetical protein